MAQEGRSNCSHRMPSGPSPGTFRWTLGKLQRRSPSSTPASSMNSGNALSQRH